MQNKKENNTENRPKRERNARKEGEERPDGIVLGSWIEPCLKLNFSVGFSITSVNIVPRCLFRFEWCFLSLQLKSLLTSQSQLLIVGTSTRPHFRHGATLIGTSVTKSGKQSLNQSKQIHGFLPLTIKISCLTL